MTSKIVITMLCLYLLLSLFCLMGKDTKINKLEGFTDTTCPDILIQQGQYLYLKNNKLAEIPGINPIKFNNLDEYVEYLQWQRSQGKRCPVLYLQNSFDIQGNLVYINRQSPFVKAGGTPIISGQDLFNNNCSRSVDVKQNQNLSPMVDKQVQDTGLYTPLDKMFHTNSGSVSPNAMDPNWGGNKYTQSRIEAGDYKDNNVKIYVP